MSVRLTKAIDVADAANAILVRVQSFDGEFLPKDKDWSGRAAIGIDPMLLALSMELALKAWFMFDFDTTDVKRSHNLRKLFLALAADSQTKLDNAFKATVAPVHYPRAFYGDLSISDILEHHANAFVDWRYLHEAQHLHFDQSAFIATLEMVLGEFRKRYRTVPSTPLRAGLS